MAATQLGPKLHLRDLQPQDLPAHPDLASLQQSATPPTLAAFATDILSEAEHFATTDWQTNFTTKSTGKASSPSTATVDLVVRDVNATELPSSALTPGASGIVETWFGRVSVHDNAAAPGTASFSEFEAVLLDKHSENEAGYTPDIFHAHSVLRWDDDDHASQLSSAVAGWRKVSVSAWEMCHNLPAPLKPRLFCTLVVSALRDDGKSFVTAQLPVDLSSVPGALYATGRNRTEGATAEQRRDMVQGIYVSVERAELVDAGTKTKWSMATASDARGNLPVWTQKMAMPGAVAKDVGFVVGYVEKLRKGEVDAP